MLVIVAAGWFLILANKRAFRLPRNELFETRTIDLIHGPDLTHNG
jgi:hypothetical protein